MLSPPHRLPLLTVQVKEHLASGIPTPFIPGAPVASAPNYLRVAFHHHGRAGDDAAHTASTGWMEQQSGVRQGSAAGAEDRGGEDRGGGGSGEAAAAASVARHHQVSQQRLARRIMMELVRHGACHLSATSGPARTAAVRAMAMVTDALAAARGLEALALTSSSELRQPDGFMLPVTTFTLALAAGLDPTLRVVQRDLLGSGIGHGSGALGGTPQLASVVLLDPRLLPHE